jgi:hypothetical protein
MIVLDANILIRAVLGRRVRQVMKLVGPENVRLLDAELFQELQRTPATVSATLPIGRNLRSGLSY